MGEAAVVSHSKGKEHIANVRHRSLSVHDFFSRPASVISSLPVAFAQQTAAVGGSVASADSLSNLAAGSPVSSVTTVSSFASSAKDVLRVEVIWALDVAVKHYSFESSETERG